MFLKLFWVFLEQSRICHPHIVLQFQSCFIWTRVFPLHLYLSNGVISEKNFTPIKNTVQFHWEYPSGSTWITFQSITWVASCTYFFKIEIWWTFCILILGGKSTDMPLTPLVPIFRTVCNTWVIIYQESLSEKISFLVLP